MTSLPHDAFRISLYYCYVTIEDVQAHIEFQKNFCENRGLKGRIRVSSEGINGVLSGRVDSLQDYETALTSHLSESAQFHPNDLDIKYCRLRDDLSVEPQLFQDLIVQATQQVISLVDTNQIQNHLANKNHKHRRKKKELNDALEPLNNPVETIWTRVLDKLQQGTEQASAEYLTPFEWNEHLAQVALDNNAILLDCRNFYESNIGHFTCPNATTLLTNTRKYQELPQTLLQQQERLASSKQIFMYCTGGVRCERASAFLKELLDTNLSKTKVYQLHGGIQRYLEQTQSSPSVNYYRGKNFVFDPRRTDPLHNGIVGVCLVCQQHHDDYDNGAAPSQNKEARCCTCRILVLVCDSCRSTVACWGDEDSDKKRIYCGLTECIHKPRPRLIECNEE